VLSGQVERAGCVAERDALAPRRSESYYTRSSLPAGVSGCFRRRQGARCRTLVDGDGSAAWAIGASARGSPADWSARRPLRRGRSRSALSAMGAPRVRPLEATTRPLEIAHFSHKKRRFPTTFRGSDGRSSAKPVISLGTRGIACVDRRARATTLRRSPPRRTGANHPCSFAAPTSDSPAPSHALLKTLQPRSKGAARCYRSRPRRLRIIDDSTAARLSFRMNTHVGVAHPSIAHPRSSSAACVRGLGWADTVGPAAGPVAR